jgi:hypothetical protein
VATTALPRLPTIPSLGGARPATVDPLPTAPGRVPAPRRERLALTPWWGGDPQALAARYPTVAFQSLLEAIIYHYFATVKHWVNGLQFAYQEAITALGINISRDFTRADFIVRVPWSTVVDRRGVDLDPFTDFTHPDLFRDLLKSGIIEGQGFQVVYLAQHDVESLDPGDEENVVELALRGVDVSGHPLARDR